MTFKSLYEITRYACEKYSDNIFFKDINSQTILYKEIPSQIHFWQEKLSALKVFPGDTVAFSFELNLNNVILILALYTSNIKCVPIYPQLPESTIEYILNLTSANLFIIDSKSIFSTNLSESFHDKYKVLDYESIARIANTNHNYYIDIGSKIDPNDVNTIIFSSGSTGMPKGIMIQHSNLAKGATIVANYLNVSCKDHILTPLRPNFDYGLNQIWQTLLTGASMSSFSMRTPFLFFEYLQKLKPTIVPLMPAIIDILIHPPIDRLSKKFVNQSVRLVCSSGGKLTNNKLEWLEHTFKYSWICPMYGLTESFRSTYVPKKMYKKKKNSIGIPIPECDVRIIDKSDNELRPGEIGELVHLGGCISLGYLGLRHETERRFRPLKTLPDQPCVRSGDLAFKDKDGYIYFVGRNDDLIKSQGIRVNPAEIEEQLITINGCIKACAFGSDPSLGSQSINAVITVTNEFDLEKFNLDLKEKIPSHLRPTKYCIIDDFPLTGNGGKINRAFLKRYFLDSKDIINIF